jgi:2'-5' RNA ligase
MQGIVSLLDEKNFARVKALGEAVESHCGLTGISQALIPHLSWHVAERYQLEPLRQTLRDIVEMTGAFTVRAAGLGIFTGPTPVIYISLVKDAFLLNFHQRLWQLVQPLSEDSSPYYDPPAWMPHITLAHGEGVAEKLDCTVQWLAFQSFEWEVKLDHLLFASANSSNSWELQERYLFGGGG